MPSLSVQESPLADGILYEISGAINEHAVLPPVTMAPLIRLRFGEITALNSVGIRTWCQWVTLFQSAPRVEVERAPILLVKCFNQVQGSRPDPLQVISFYVPFLSERTGERKDLLVTRDAYSIETGKMTLPRVLDSEGHPMEVDVLDNYFYFLKK